MGKETYEFWCRRYSRLVMAIGNVALHECAGDYIQKFAEEYRQGEGEEDLLNEIERVLGEFGIIETKEV